jgi:Tol biopolymer transport system component
MHGFYLESQLEQIREKRREYRIMRFHHVTFLALCLVPAVVMAQKPPKNPPPSAPFVPAIAYVQRVNTGASDLMLLNAEGTEIRTLLAGSATVQHGSPSFSPDGSRIVFRSNLAGAGLYVIPTDGSAAPRKLIGLNAHHGWSVPAWSPDGRLILYSDSSGRQSDFGGSDRDLYLIEVDADANLVEGSFRVLTDTTDKVEYAPSWSRDGTRFAANVWISSNEEQVFVFNFDETLRTVTSSESVTAAIGKMHIAGGRPQWNRTATLPDVIVFGATLPSDTTKYDLWFVEADSRRAGRLLQIANNYEGSPSWSPDDNKVAFLNQATKGKDHDVSILTNARELFLGASASPIIQRTTGKTGSKVFDLADVVWKPVP